MPMYEFHVWMVLLGALFSECANLFPQVEPHTNVDEETYTEPPGIDENGNVDLSRIMDENGVPHKQYPLPPDKRDRRNEFENAIMNGYLTKKALEEGREPPPRRYQSDVSVPPRALYRPGRLSASFCFQFDRKFHEWQQRRWQNYQDTRQWAETGAPRALWLFDKPHDGDFIRPGTLTPAAIRQFVCDA